jgi:RNA polymerase sigma-70 factor (ECF subfamily)
LAQHAEGRAKILIFGDISTFCRVSITSMRHGPQHEDWAAVIDRLLEGDQLACLQISRLVTWFLVGWRAYDFRDEWPDLVQDVLLVVITVAREGKIRNREASFGYIRTVAHHKFVDHLRRHLRWSEDQSLPWGDVIQGEGFEAQSGDSPEESLDLQLAMEKLPERKREIVLGVYGEGKTYEQVAQETGTPLGTLKGYLGASLAELRAHFAEEPDDKSSGFNGSSD